MCYFLSQVISVKRAEKEGKKEAAQGRQSRAVATSSLVGGHLLGREQKRNSSGSTSNRKRIYWRSSIRLRRRKRATTTNNDASMTVGLIMITCAFLILSISAGMFHEIGQSDDPRTTIAEKKFAQLQAEIMSVLNNSMSFLCYFISGNLFRATFRKVFFIPYFRPLRRLDC